ncbi:hypothetical protein [Enterococcus casseliflavus]|uniref:hypothetical protein n=1 Tax=Enterococcus casseliflavus TaxID=37734 RepID=UPI0039A57D40
MSKERKKEVRKKLLKLLNENPNWLDNDDAREQIQLLGQFLGYNSKNNKVGDLTLEKYLKLLELNFNNVEIMAIYKISEEDFKKWLKDQDLYRRSSQEILNENKEFKNHI